MFSSMMTVLTAIANLPRRSPLSSTSDLRSTSGCVAASEGTTSWHYGTLRIHLDSLCSYNIMDLYDGTRTAHYQTVPLVTCQRTPSSSHYIFIERL